jgi:dTDP-4-amino-4,6-dideoxygalactose transaminase
MDVSDLARHNATDVVFEEYPERGFNVRMTDMQAALGLCQLEALDEILEMRRRLADRYTAALAGSALEPPYDPPYAVRTWQSYCVRVGLGAAVPRTELMRRLLADGIPTRRGVMAIHEEAAYAGATAHPLPHTEQAARDTMMLPLFPGLTDAQQDHVIDRVLSHTVALAA